LALDDVLRTCTCLPNERLSRGVEALLHPWVEDQALLHRRGVEALLHPWVEDQALLRLRQALLRQRVPLLRVPLLRVPLLRVPLLRASLLMQTGCKVRSPYTYRPLPFHSQACKRTLHSGKPHYSAPHHTLVLWGQTGCKVRCPYTYWPLPFHSQACKGSGVQGTLQDHTGSVVLWGQTGCKVRCLNPYWPLSFHSQACKRTLHSSVGQPRRSTQDHTLVL